MLKSIYQMSHDGSTRSYLEMDLCIPLQLTLPPAEIEMAATRLGRDCGRDHDWVPETLEEAAYEILCYSGSLETARKNGIVPHLGLRGHRDKLFCLTIDLILEDEVGEIMESAAPLSPTGELEDLASACLSILMSQDSPLDYGVEIKDARTALPDSNHERMAREERIRASRALKKRMSNDQNQQSQITCA